MIVHDTAASEGWDPGADESWEPAVPVFRQNVLRMVSGYHSRQESRKNGTSHGFERNWQQDCLQHEEITAKKYTLRRFFDLHSDTVTRKTASLAQNGKLIPF